MISSPRPFSSRQDGAIGLSTDNITYHPQTGAEIVHPPADWHTPTRVETLLNFLPTGLATVITYHSSWGQDTQFAQNLAKDAGRYLPQQPQKPAARKADVHSMHSNKTPIAMRVDTSLS